jgi:hypothetical protein
MAAIFSPNPKTAEEGGASPFSWDSVTTGANTTYTLSTAQKHGGSYSYAAYANNTTNKVYGKETFTGTGVFYTDFYLYIPSTLRGGAWDYCGFLQVGNDEYNYIQLMIGFNGSSVPEAFCIVGGNYTSWDYLTTALATDEWLHCEFFWDYGSGAATQMYFKVNGTTVYTSSTLTFSYSTVTYADYGMTEGCSGAVTGTIYHDDIYGYDAVPSAGGTTGAVLYYHHRHHNE